jgi:plastocyanin
MHFWTIRKRTAIFILAAGFALAAAASWWLLRTGDTVVFNQNTGTQPREIHMVNGEFAATLKSGKKIEAYRWDPGTIFVEKGENVRLVIYGVNGEEHPFHIENTTIKGTVKKGEETAINLSFEKEGVYRLICEVHPDKEHNGPMIAYIIVD